ncbi:hypothetical protein NLG97_g2383 [Lecanicillium saksenae]|uniref:Uncharacterized protein n=1 Tax=Lecanicillium saksenae TaxID=468837 RepID=A0ACC1R4C2_9HYPO|nr:hypothetical protein NLG97_g2383 [Lecanicillium saksenae]
MVSASRGRGRLAANLVLLAAQILSSNALDWGDDANTCDESTINIVSQPELAGYESCRVLSGYNLYIDACFKGPFDLPNVQAIPLLYAGAFGPPLRGQTAEDDGVTSVSMLDLQKTTNRGISFGYLPHLENVSLPKLESIALDLAIAGNPKLRSISLPSLKRVAGGMYIDGPFDNIELPSLISASYLEIKSTGNISCPAIAAKLASVHFTADENDISPGFKCSASGPDNGWDSTEPRHNATEDKGTGNTSKGGSTTGGGSAPSSKTE